MLRDIDVAKYFLSKDKDRKLFNKNLIERNNRIFYEGNARLNKYLHLAQNIYIAKTGEKLFEDDLYAYDNGAVSPKVQENFSVLFAKHDEPVISDEDKKFLDEIFAVFRNATLEDMIELSHEDSEWIDKQSYYEKEDQRMNSLSHVAEYRTQYGDILKVMENMAE